MENPAMQRLRYHAKKYNLRLRRVANGYRFYSGEGDLVSAVDNFICDSAMTLDAAKAASIEISMNFSRTLRPADTEILLTRLNGSAINKYSAVADSVIFAAPLEFLRSDGFTKKFAFIIWYFGAVAQVFIKHFGLFGNLFFPAKKPADEAGNV